MNFLTTNWLGILVGALLAGALAIIPLNILNERNGTLTARPDLARNQVTSLSSQIETQNASIKAMADAAERNRAVYLAGLKAAENRAVRLTIDAEDILALPTPTDPAMYCEGAAGILREVTR